jgi:putative transcriptional regulator
VCGRFAFFSILAVALCFPGLPRLNGALPGEQHGSDQQLSVGNILVASEKLADPNFAQSVILIVQHDAADGTVGLIVNRPTKISVSRLFPKMKHVIADPVYMGGPVGITAVQALLRLPKRTDQATHVMADVYVTGMKALIEKSIASHLDSSKFRLYMGYGGWAPGQLEAEIRLGAWTILNPRPEIAFDGDPGSLWSRLVRESHMQIAFTPHAACVDC